MTRQRTGHANRSQLSGVCALLLIAGGFATGLTGCRGERTEEPPRQFIPDMDDSPKFKPQTNTEFFENGRSMRPLVRGTVAFGDSQDPTDIHRASFLKESAEVYEGVDSTKPANKDGSPATVKYIPGEVLENFIAAQGQKNVHFADNKEAFTKMLDRGQERFNIYCAVCHGTAGEGGNPAKFTGGVVGRRWSSPVPSYHDAKYLDRELITGTDGHIFRTARYGVPGGTPDAPLNMPAYADKINVADAWAIVAYIRVLQNSWKDNVNQVPADLRSAVDATRPKPGADAPANVPVPASGATIPVPNPQHPQSEAPAGQAPATPPASEKKS